MPRPPQPALCPEQHRADVAQHYGSTKVDILCCKVRWPEPALRVAGVLALRLDRKHLVAAFQKQRQRASRAVQCLQWEITAWLTNLMRRTLVSPASFPAVIVASRCAGLKYAGTYAKRRCSSSPAAKTTHVCRHELLHKQLCAGVTMGVAGADVVPQRVSWVGLRRCYHRDDGASDAGAMARGC